MHLMNQNFQPFLGKFVVVYFKDNLIYSLSLKEHIWHQRQIFNVLSEEQLFANLAKHEYLVTKINFLGLVIS